MNIVFTCGRSREKAPSFQFLADNLEEVNESYPDVSLGIHNDPLGVDYTAYDVALFMGYDEQTGLAKKQNPKIVTGVFDPRAGRSISFSSTDFIAANDIESKDYFSQFCETVITYYAQPTVPPKQPCPITKDAFIIGYHGNTIHLDAMYPRITDALEKLHRDTPIELWSMSPLKKTERWDREKDLSFPVRHIQYGEENYARYIAHVDVGLVPQLMPVTQNSLLRYVFGTFRKRYNESANDYILRFKETTNRGRHLVFAQYGVPVISDMTPSACDFIRNEENSFLAHHTEAWYYALRALANDSDLCQKLGEQLRATYNATATRAQDNEKLVQFLRKKVV